MNKTYIIAAFLMTVLLFPIKTLAWGKKGHAYVAEVAFSYLDENTKKTVTNRNLTSEFNKNLKENRNNTKSNLKKQLFPS